MKNTTTITGLAIVAGAMTCSAEVLLLIDPTVINEITIIATGERAIADASTSVFTGFYLEGFFNDLGVMINQIGEGNLTTAANPSDNTPSIFSSPTSFGLNIWSFSTNSTVSVSEGVQAFTGSATWTVSSEAYLAYLAGPGSGNIVFGADTDDDIAEGTVIGRWGIPSPGSLAAFGLGGIFAVRRRR
tara:strand:- start:11681 stop:12241 length:561 start_codon:yes stop_codon:yes gene_type:complete